MREINEELSFVGPPQDVFELISSGAFQLQLITHLGGTEGETVEESRRPDGSVRLVTRQQTAVELPGFARKLIPAKTTVIHTYEWGCVDPDGGRRGSWSADIHGAPVTVGGATELLPHGEGTVQRYLGTIRSSVPVVGVRLEAFALDALRRDLALTETFVAARLQI